MSRYDQYQDVRIYCARGTRLPQAKLTEDKVAIIRREFVPYSRTNGARALARRHGLHVNTIWRITSGDTWAHVGASS
jgi:hypothetical protein